MHGLALIDLFPLDRIPTEVYGKFRYVVSKVSMG
jgi:hypothetical protein